MKRVTDNPREQSQCQR